MNIQTIAAGLIIEKTMDEAKLETAERIDLLISIMASRLAFASTQKPSDDMAGELKEIVDLIAKSLLSRVEQLAPVVDVVRDAKLDNKDEPEVMAAKIKAAIKRAEDAIKS